MAMEVELLCDASSIMILKQFIGKMVANMFLIWVVLDASMGGVSLPERAGF